MPIGRAMWGLAVSRRAAVLAVVATLTFTAGDAHAQAWTPACSGAEATAGGQSPRAEISGDRVRVWIEDNATGRTVFARTVRMPHWRTRFGAECPAGGISGVTFVRVHGRLAIHVELSVSDLCEEGRHPTCLTLLVPRGP